jgi:23S rRNA (cytosine1962-C5)-methyltransferase
MSLGPPTDARREPGGVIANDLLDRLPGPGDRRIAVRVTEDARRQIRGGHPWVFESSITSSTTGGRPGDVAVVFDRDRRFQAIGLYDPASPIRVKVLHHGAPVQITPAWWRQRFEEALGRRRTLLATPGTTGFRCVHGENDGLPGLVVDRYGSALVIKLYSAAWVPHLRTVVAGLEPLLAPELVVVRLSRAVRREAGSDIGDGTVVVGQPPAGPVLFRENHLVLEADVVAGQKTGHFLDQRDNRRLVREAAPGARVLDVFACTGGFSLAAAAGGARSVRAVDVSARALEAVGRNFRRNRHLPSVRRCHPETTVGDAFEVMAALAAGGARFDIVVVDPPSFAPRQANVATALRAYRRLTHLALGLVAEGGLLVQASCSSRVTAPEFFAGTHQAAANAGFRLDEVRRTGHPADHPVGFEHGAYLKALFARVHRPAWDIAAPARA